MEQVAHLNQSPSHIWQCIGFDIPLDKNDCRMSRDQQQSKMQCHSTKSNKVKQSSVGLILLASRSSATRDLLRHPNITMWGVATVISTRRVKDGGVIWCYSSSFEFSGVDSLLCKYWRSGSGQLIQVQIGSKIAWNRLPLFAFYLPLYCASSMAVMLVL